MATLTIRNLSTTPLELTKVERFEGAPAAAAGFGLGDLLWRLLRAPRDLLAGAAATTTEPSGGHRAAVVPKAGAAPTASDAVADVRVDAFATRRTAIPGPAPGREVLRLTLEAVLGGDARRAYTVDVPAAAPKSIELQPVDAVDGGDGKAFTAVYTPADAHVAVLSSAALDAWMAGVDGAWPLSSLSLPGTHNSPACHLALPSVRCQAVDVRAQLDNGVRFLDVRVSVNPPGQPHADAARLALVHSAFPVGLLGTHVFDELYAAVCAFLDAHPSETVLLSVKREGTGKGSDHDLARALLARYTGPPGENKRRDAAQPGSSNTADGPHPWRWYTAPQIPTLDEVRGRIVLIRRFGLPGDEPALAAGWGLDGSVWPDNCADGICGTGLMRLQDFYDVAQTTSIDTKIAYVHALLDQAGGASHAKAAGGLAAQAASPPLPPLFINFLTGSNFFNARCWPENVAAQVNPSVLQYLCVRHNDTDGTPDAKPAGDGATGIVVTDWVGHRGDWDLIRCVVAWNARLQLK